MVTSREGGVSAHSSWRYLTPPPSPLCWQSLRVAFKAGMDDYKKNVILEKRAGRGGGGGQDVGGGGGGLAICRYDDAALYKRVCLLGFVDLTSLSQCPKGGWGLRGGGGGGGAAPVSVSLHI